MTNETNVTAHVNVTDDLYNVYCKTMTAKELWESLERKYKTEDDGTKKGQQVGSKNTYAPDSAKADMVEHVGSSSKSNSKAKRKGKKKNNKKGKRKAEYLAPKAEIAKQKFQGTCYNCDQPGHHVVNCKMLKRVNPRQANMVNDNMDMIDMVSDVIAMISKVNMYDKFVLSKNQMYVGKGYVVNGMFKLNVMVVKNDINKMNSFAHLIESSNMWHGRLGHVNFNSMRYLIKFNSIPNFHIDSKYKCETCVEDKLIISSFKSVKQKTEPLDMIHIDICDLKSLPTKGGNKYFITFIDDCTKYCYVYLLKSKYEAIDKFVLYKTEVENQLGQKIKVVRSNRGGEYVSLFAELYAKHGIRHDVTAHYSPQQNGIAERKNRTLKEMVNAMLISSGLSQDMWGEAILTATYLLNKIPRKEKEETPYELWM
nr:Pol polyprotein [Tanacetum cinerariifolium]